MCQKFKELHHPTKGLLKIPFEQYVINDEQQLAVMGIDFKKEGVEMDEAEGLKFDQLGKFEDQNVIFQSQILNSLENDNWDFEKYPNPEIVLITIIDESKIIWE